MNLLVLGGTRFLGRHLVDAACAAGHRVTLFNRGRTAPGLFADVGQLRGDRDGELAALGVARWDAVIDMCGYVPRVVQQSVERLSTRVDRYLFVSSVSVYADFSRAGIVEDAPVLRLTDPNTEDVLPNYGALKAACEAVVQSTFAARSLIVCPGLIVGPNDPTARFSYWIRRCARGGPMLVPNVPEYPIQLIDVRDLARWMIGLVERGAHGVFNAVGPSATLSLSRFLSDCAKALGTNASPVWVPVDYLIKQGVQAWSDLPLWAGDEERGIAQVDGARAWSAGLRLRPLEETARDTWRWIQANAATASSGGLTDEREAELLAAWRRPPHLDVTYSGSADRGPH